MLTLWKIIYGNAKYVRRNRGDHMDNQMAIMPIIKLPKECRNLVEKVGLPLFEEIILRL